MKNSNIYTWIILFTIIIIIHLDSKDIESANEDVDEDWKPRHAKTYIHPIYDDNDEDNDDEVENPSGNGIVLTRST